MDLLRGTNEEALSAMHMFCMLQKLRSNCIWRPMVSSFG